METTKTTIITEKDVRLYRAMASDDYTGWICYKDGMYLSFNNRKKELTIKFVDGQHVDHIRVNGTVPADVTDRLLDRNKTYLYWYEDFQKYDIHNFKIEIEVTNCHFYFNEKIS